MEPHKIIVRITNNLSVECYLYLGIAIRGVVISSKVEKPPKYVVQCRSTGVWCGGEMVDEAVEKFRMLFMTEHGMIEPVTATPMPIDIDGKLVAAYVRKDQE